MYVLTGGDIPLPLREIPDPPKSLHLRGAFPKDKKLLAVVGPQNYSVYGKEVTEHLIQSLSTFPVGIVSNMGRGIGEIAHKTALRHNMYTLGVPPSGLRDTVLHPQALAHDILETGGLISEYDPDTEATSKTYTKRNRLIVGIADAVLIPEAEERSETLICARLAAEYNRDLLIVPGNIFSETARGTHQFLKLGATPVTSTEDILEALLLV